MEQLTTSIEERGAVLRAVKVTVPAVSVAEGFDAAYRKLSKSAQVRGFRKGKVPRKVLEETYGDSVQEEVVRDLIQHACGHAIQDNDLDVVSDPELLSQKMAESGDLEFEALVEIRPQFELGNYRDLEVERRIVRVTDEHVDSTISGIRERMAALQTEEDRVNVASGDVIVFDMYAFSEGQPIESASGEGVQLEVGSGRFPEDFEKQIIGVTRGIRTPIDVRFPEDQGDPELAGKLVRFEVTIREIKNKILPKLDDDFAAEVYDDCEDMEQLRTKIREQLNERAGHEADQRLRGELIEKIVEAHEFEVPPSIVERQMAATLRDMGVREIPDDRIEEIRSALQPAAISRVRATFLLDAIAKAEELEIGNEEVQEEIRRQLVAAGAEAEQVRNHYGNPSAVGALHGRMLRDKAIDRVVESATTRDVDVDEVK